MPYSAAKYRSRSYTTCVRDLLAANAYDAVIVDHAQLAWLATMLPPSQRLIGMVHNIENAMYRDLAQEPGRRSWSRAVYAREARLIEYYERQLGARAQELWALTESDAQYYRGLTPRLVRVLPLPGGKGAVPQSYPKVFDVALIGNWCWRANRDGLDWFLHRVHPHLPKNLSIHVAGGGAQWLERRYPNVVYRGFVRDAQEFLAQARVVAIPTLSGGGIQIKTLDAIASGSQIVANPIAVRGIANAPSTVRVADDPAAFADALRIAAAQPDCAAATAEALRWTRRREQLLLDTIAHALQISACQLQPKADPTHTARAQPCLPST
jgi:hypothetical protein